MPALDKGELIEAILTPLSDQFDLMRQQMFEQLQQAGVVLFERFTAIQDEQVRALRDELEQIRLLTRELDALRGDLAAQSERLNSAPERFRPGSAWRRSLPAARSWSEAQSSSPGPSPTATDMPTVTAMGSPGPNRTRLRKRR